ncbi:hypothetical protein AB0J14_05220 [Micromonospora arborensis]|uniref:hypothetical protein n=1 Tax=Micromonospora arborensis TaxID=2116518 RepID=UPI0033D34934
MTSLPARTGRMNLIFVHRPCGYEVGYATTLPLRLGLCCHRCDPECERPGSTDWRQVMKDDPDAAELAARWQGVAA